MRLRLIFYAHLFPGVPIQAIFAKVDPMRGDRLKRLYKLFLKTSPTISSALVSLKGRSFTLKDFSSKTAVTLQEPA